LGSTVRLYELYSMPGGRLSNRTQDNSGTRIAVAASSSDEAHDLARQGVRASAPDKPHGILWVATKGESPDHELFNGDRVWNDPLMHGAGKQAITRWMQSVLDG
jgi:hypothetical protein